MNTPRIGIIMVHLASLTLIALLVGCVSSPPARFFTLNMVPSGNVAPQCNIDIGRVSRAESLVKPSILVKKGPTEIEYYANAEWSAGVDELVREKLEAEFGPHNPDRHTIVVSGMILAFEQEDTPGGAQAHIKMELEHRGGDATRFSEPLLKKIYEATLPAESTSAPAVVEALSQCLEGIAGDIAADANNL